MKSLYASIRKPTLPASRPHRNVKGKGSYSRKGKKIFD